MEQNQIIKQIQDTDLPENKKKELLDKITKEGLTDEIKEEIFDLISFETDKTDLEIAQSNAKIAALEGKSANEFMQDTAKTVNDKFAELEDEGKKKIADSKKKMKDEAAKTQSEIDQAAADAIKSSIK